MISDALRADQRYRFGVMLKERGDLAAAADLFAEALDLAPDWAEVRFALAEAYEALGRIEEAAEAYKDYLRAAEADVMGASVRLAVLGAALVPDKLPEPYVRTLFDQYADRFDTALVERLDYRGPEHLRAALDAVRPVQGASERVLDLGCGTGLGGAAVRDRAAWLEGLDLSPAMVAKAERKGLYDKLHVGDMLALPPLPQDGRAFDLVIAADAVIYLGDLAPLFVQVGGRLAPGGLFAFTTQKGDDEAEFALGAECRYSHGRPYLERLAAAHGFAVARMDETVCRREGGRDVACLVAVLILEGDASEVPPLTELVPDKDDIPDGSPRAN